MNYVYKLPKECSILPLKFHLLSLTSNTFERQFYKIKKCSKVASIIFKHVET